jgi:glycosyltransferase involved in cell wall biosynthesis
MTMDGPGRPLSVGVTVDLHRGLTAGGHVKTWERLLEAAGEVPDEVDLTVYVLGDIPSITEVAPNSRFVALAPVRGSLAVHARLGRPDDATDLARYHPGIAARIRWHDVWHVTHLFSLSRTAGRLAQRTGRPLTASVQTDVAALTVAYISQLARDRDDRGGGRGAGRAGTAGMVRGRLTHSFAATVAATMRRRQNQLLRQCDHLLVSNADDLAAGVDLLSAQRVSFLRRGVDLTMFNPARADRSWLTQRFGVPTGATVVLFAGRVDRSKRAMTIARAVRRLADEGRPVHLFVAGAGADVAPIRALLGPRATLPGVLAQDDLARVQASADLFAFPSESETAGNVVTEALASGTVVLVPRSAHTAQWLNAPGRDGILVDGRSDVAWASAIGDLVDRPDVTRAIAVRARQTAERFLPSWRDVLVEDLLAVWRSTTAWPRVPRQTPKAGRAAPVG